jgi:hypothetical protein
MTVRRDDCGLVDARRNAIFIRGGRQGSHCRCIESLDDQPDAKPQLPNELRDDHEEPKHGRRLEDPEQDAHETGEEQGAGWVRDIREQTARAGAAFFFKQWGGAKPKSGGRKLDGRTWDEMPHASRDRDERIEVASSAR